MEVVAVKSFYKDARRCPKHIQEQANEVLHVLEGAVNLQSSGLDYRKCAGSKRGESYYRIRVGDWRIGAELRHPQIIVITILSRGQIYKKFPPK